MGSLMNAYMRDAKRCSPKPKKYITALYFGWFTGVFRTNPCHPHHNGIGNKAPSILAQARFTSTQASLRLVPGVFVQACSCSALIKAAAAQAQRLKRNQRIYIHIYIYIYILIVVSI